MRFYLQDDERCAFGRGWEAKRRGLPMSANPFTPDHWMWEDWRDGWRQFRPPANPVKEEAK